MRNPTRLFLAALAVPLLGACGDSGPTHPTDATPGGNAAAAKRISGGFTLTGRATTTVRRLDGRRVLGTVLATESGRYSASIDAAGNTTGALMIGFDTSEVTILAAEKRTRRSGTWSRTIRSRSSGDELTLLATAANGGPVTEWEVRRRGIVISRTANTWHRSNGVWRLSQSVTTSYSDSEPAASITTDFDDGVVAGWPIAGMAAAKLSPAAIAIPSDRPELSEYGVCEAEMRSLEDAFDVYVGASIGFLGCLKGPIACIAAGTAYTLAYRRLIRAFDQADECLAAY